MKVKELLSLMENGAAHITIWGFGTGEIFAETIWFDEISAELLEAEIKSVRIERYSIKLGVVL